MLDLSKLGFKKVISRKYEDCELYVASRDDSEYLIVIFERSSKEKEGSGYYYFKIMRAGAFEWNCETILYYPYGLFGFARSKEELISKISEKLARL